MRTVVVLLHGMGRTSRSMSVLARYLAADGYRVEHHRYPSMRGRVEEHARTLRVQLDVLDADASVERIHLVTHSMGGIVVRAALSRSAPGKVSRVVMLAPPNRGSKLARMLAQVSSWPPTLAQLSDAPDSFVNTLPDAPPVEVGVIAGAYDGKVPVANTHLSSETDHLVVPAFHSFLAVRRDVMRQTAAFLRDGRFARP